MSRLFCLALLLPLLFLAPSAQARDLGDQRIYAERTYPDGISPRDVAVNARGDRVALLESGLAVRPVGGTWSEPVPVPGATILYGVDIAGDGTILVLGTAWDPDTESDRTTVVVEGRPGAWQAPYELGVAPTGTNPVIDVNEAGDAIVSYFARSSAGVLHNFYRPAGSAWGLPVVTGQRPTDWGQAAVDEAGTATVVWGEGDHGIPPAALHTLTLAKAAEPVSSSTPLPEPIADLHTAVADGGVAVGGLDFESSVRVQLPDGSQPRVSPRGVRAWDLTVLPDGRWAVAWGRLVDTTNVLEYAVVDPASGRVSAPRRLRSTTATDRSYDEIRLRSGPGRVLTMTALIESGEEAGLWWLGWVPGQRPSVSEVITDWFRVDQPAGVPAVHYEVSPVTGAGVTAWELLSPFAPGGYETTVRTVEPPAPSAWITSRPRSWLAVARAEMAWAGSDDRVDSFRVESRVVGSTGPFGDWETWLGDTSETSGSIRVRRGSTACVRVSAVASGVVSEPSRRQCVSRPFDGNDLRQRGRWAERPAAGAVGGSWLESLQQGARLSKRVAPGRLGVRLRTCEGCGRVRITYRGERVWRGSLAGTRGQRLVEVDLPGTGPGRVVLRVVTSGRPVAVDWLGIRRT